MPRVHKLKRPCERPQEKAKVARQKSVPSPSGSMIAFVRTRKQGLDAAKSKETAPVDEGHLSSATHNVEEEVPMEDIETEQEVEMTLAEKSASEEGGDTDGSRDIVRRRSLQMFSDVSSWPLPLTDYLQLEIVKRGSALFQNKDGPFAVVTRNNEKAKGAVRRLSKDWFYKVMPTGEKVLRSWMVYSPVSERLYCFCCRLLATRVTATTSSFVTGFQKWWKLNPNVRNHEESALHQRCFKKWKILATGLRLRRMVNTEAMGVIDEAKSKWRSILHQLLEIMLYLGRQNKAFHSHREDDSSSTKGNLLEAVELLSRSNAVLKEHLLTLRQSTKAPEFFLSPDTQNECISVLTDHVKEMLVAEIKSAGYFGIVFDTLSDVGHTDQISAVIRYVKNNTMEERFLGFYSLEGKNAADLSAEILKNMESDGLDITMCRSQGYDNAASMAGVHGGIQAIIREKNKKALFNGCVDHSLDLCGRHSFDGNASCTNFFGTFDSTFSFFAASAKRWDILIAHTGVSLKRVSTTPWCAHPAAVKLVRENFDKVVAALEALREPPTHLETRWVAENILRSVLDFTFQCYLNLWGEVLEEVNNTQQSLQREGLTLDEVVTNVEKLSHFLQKKRSHLVERAIELVRLKAEQWKIVAEKRGRTKKKVPKEQARDVELVLQEENNKKAMLECIDRFRAELQVRQHSIKEIAAVFEAVQAKSLVSATDEQLKVSIPKLTTLYDEISESGLLTDIGTLRRHLRMAQIDPEKANHWEVLDVLSFIAEHDNQESLPNLSRSLRLFLTVWVSVVSRERNFSKRKFIKNYLRSPLGCSRLSGLAMLSAEYELVKSIDFDEVVDKFVDLQARKGKF